MADRATARSGLPATAYYAPDFQIEVEGLVLDPVSKGDVLNLKVDMGIGNVDRFQFTVNNWDDRKLSFKYSDTRLFNLNNRVTVKLGYAGDLAIVMHGQIESLGTHFPENGSPTLAVAGSSGLSKLRNRKADVNEQKLFLKKKDSEIAQLVAARNNLTLVATDEGPQHEKVWQGKLDDASFLQERARKIGFDLYVQTDQDTGQEVLYFVKPKDPNDPGTVKAYVFEWGKSLILFTSKINASHQVESVTVRGWDPEKKERIEAKAEWKGQPGNATSGPLVAKGKGDQVVDVHVTSQEEAQKLAESLLHEKANQFLTGEGKVIGLPGLRPGDIVELRGLGTRFSGNYKVISVSHSLGADGFTTTFGVQRPNDGGTKS